MPGCIDKRLSKLSIDAPISELVGIGQGIAGDRASNTHVVAFGPLGTKTCFNVPKAFPIGKLCKCHTKILVETGEVFDFAVSSIPLNTSSKCMYGHVIHHL